jgi:hypothetical protein
VGKMKLLGLTQNQSIKGIGYKLRISGNCQGP